MLKRNQRVLAMLLAIALMLACAPVVATPIALPPTFDMLSINTAIAQTAGAAATQTALMIPPTLTPTVTALPTKTPLPTETPTPTFIFILATSTVPSSTPTSSSTPKPPSTRSGLKFDCQVDRQSPQNNHAFAPGDSFDAHWWVTNTGTDKWDKTSTDYLYISGDVIHETAIYDLQKSILSGKQAEIVVEMKAPNNPGTYNTTWMIRIGSNPFCSMNMIIIVK